MGRGTPRGTHDPDRLLPGAGQTHVRCAAENADVQLGKLLDAVKALDASDGRETLVVLTADHGATYGKNFNGKTAAAERQQLVLRPERGGRGAETSTTEAVLDTLHEHLQQPSPALNP